MLLLDIDLLYSNYIRMCRNKRGFLNPQDAGGSTVVTFCLPLAILDIGGMTAECQTHYPLLLVRVNNQPALTSTFRLYIV